MRAINVRHRKTVLKSFLSAVRVSAVAKCTRTIEVAGSDTKASSDSGTGSCRRAARNCPLDRHLRVASRLLPLVHHDSVSLVADRGLRAGTEEVTKTFRFVAS